MTLRHIKLPAGEGGPSIGTNHEVSIVATVGVLSSSRGFRDLSARWVRCGCEHNKALASCRRSVWAGLAAPRPHVTRTWTVRPASPGRHADATADSQQHLKEPERSRAHQLTRGHPVKAVSTVTSGYVLATRVESYFYATRPDV